MSKTNLFSWIRIVATSGTAVAGVLAGTARFWIDPASDRASLHLTRYLATFYWLEIVLLLIATLIFLQWDKIIRTVRRRARVAWSVSIGDLEQARRRNISSEAGMRILAAGLLLVGAAYFFANIVPPAINLLKSKAALVLRYSRADFLRFLCAEASNRMSRLDYAGAESYYRSILHFYGNTEETSAVSEELRKIKLTRDFGLRWLSQARELEAANGFNRISFYNYTHVLPYLPQAADITARIRIYSSIFAQTAQFDAELRRYCSVDPASRGESFKPHGDIKSMLGLATSVYARNFLKELASSEGDVQRRKPVLDGLCLYRIKFGPVLYLLEEEMQALPEFLRIYEYVKLHGT